MLLCQFRQLMIVGRKQASRAPRGQMLGHGPGQRQAIERRGAPADFIQNHQAAHGRVVTNVGGLGHFDHER